MNKPTDSESSSGSHWKRTSALYILAGIVSLLSCMLGLAASGFFTAEPPCVEGEEIYDEECDRTCVCTDVEVGSFGSFSYAMNCPAVCVQDDVEF